MLRFGELRRQGEGTIFFSVGEQNNDMPRGLTMAHTVDGCEIHFAPPFRNPGF